VPFLLFVIPGPAKPEPGIQCLCFGRVERESHWITRRILRLALRAIGYADVRPGILPPQSGSLLRSAPE